MYPFNWQVDTCFTVLAPLLAMISFAWRGLVLAVSCWDDSQLGVAFLAVVLTWVSMPPIHADVVVVMQSIWPREQKTGGTTAFLAAPLMETGGTLFCHHWVGLRGKCLTLHEPVSCCLEWPSPSKMSQADEELHSAASSSNSAFPEGIMLTADRLHTELLAAFIMLCCTLAAQGYIKVIKMKSPTWMLNSASW